MIIMRGFLNMIGHYLKLFSLYLIYKAIIEKAIKEPFQSIFNELHNQVNTDAMTGWFNHGYLYEKLVEEIKRSRRTNKPCQFYCCSDILILLVVNLYCKSIQVYGYLYH